MSFDNLISIIGPAPNEMPRADLMQKLSTERDRVRRTLVWFRTVEPVAKPPKEKKTGGKPATKITTKMKNAGITIDDLEKALKYLARGGE